MVGGGWPKYDLFPQIFARRKKINTKNMLVDDNGQEINDMEEIEGKVNLYFKELYNPIAV